MPESLDRPSNFNPSTTPEVTEPESLSPLQDHVDRYTNRAVPIWEARANFTVYNRLGATEFDPDKPIKGQLFNSHELAGRPIQNGNLNDALRTILNKAKR